MSYIIDNINPFISIKLTELGRQKIALGALNFAYWAIGDSEINYNRESIMDDSAPKYQNVTNYSKILKPKDKQPDFKYFITTDGITNLNNLQPASINVVKAVVNNEASERGFFNNLGGSYQTYSSTTYIVSSVTVSNSIITGGTQIIATGLTYTAGDLLLFKVTNDALMGQTNFSNTKPMPNLWFKTTSASAGSTIIVDRTLPNLSGLTGTTQIITYKSGEVWDIYGSTTVPYWNSGTLSFDSCCDVTCTDVPIWNGNNVWCESPAGFTGITDNSLLYEQYWDFGSYDYIGQKHPYLYYECSSDSYLVDIICESPGTSSVDPIRKSIAIIHYTNNTISNVYGEFLYIDNTNNKTTTVEMPDLMWHRRNYATASGTTMGMTFIASGSVGTIPNSEIEYVPLIEDPTKVMGVPKTVGKVFPQLKTIVFDDDELVMATAYKSNRNWTLPSLAANLVAPQSSYTGSLETNKTMYLTYQLDNTVTGTTTGLTTSINCQYYTKITNTTPTTKDIQFRISETDRLPYMRKIELSGYDGLGFYAKNFKLLWQIVDDANDRPKPDAWKVYDYTSTAITTTTNETINPILLENQNPVVNGFLLNQPAASASTIFSIYNTLTLPLDSQSSNLQFGDERFFYGNIKAYIGATIFKTLFRLSVDANQYSITSNPTKVGNETTPIRVTEVGIYDKNRDLVMVGKLSRPISFTDGTTITIELSIDF